MVTAVTPAPTLSVIPKQKIFAQSGPQTLKVASNR
jgi:hypothetical protein